MNRLLVASVLFVGLLPGMSAAVEISNIKARYGPYGAVRIRPLKCVQMDVIVMTYDLSGLNADAKTGKAKYTTFLELLNPKGDVIFSKETTNEPIMQLGGGKMPGDLFVQIGDKQLPGKYTIRMTVTDKLEKNGNLAKKAFEEEYQVLGAKFGMVGVSAPAFGVTGTRYIPEFALVNFKLDKKGLPKGEVNIRILDEKGKQVDAMKYDLPADLPEMSDLSKVNFAPFQHQLYLNRAGHFTVEISAEDKLGEAKVGLTYPFTVIDINTLGK